MRLITEINEEVQVLTEGTDGTKSYYIEGIFLQGNIKNRNGRVYPVDILDEEVSRYTTNYIDASRAFGELGHPEGPQINLDRVSHMIKSLKKEGDNYVGKAKIMDTPFGKIAKNLIDEGAKLGVSSRGLGTLETRGSANYVQPGFTLATAADIVADPSAPDAFVRGIMESKEWVFESGVWKIKELEQFREELKKTKIRKLEEVALKGFNKFLKNL